MPARRCSTRRFSARINKTVSNEVPPGFRLFTVSADGVSSHGGLLHPDDRVDVLVYRFQGQPAFR